MSFPEALCACARVCSRSPSGRITTPLGIAREHQQILPVGRCALALRVERINVLAGNERQLTELARADLLPCLTHDRGLRVLKACPRRFQRGEATDPVRVPDGREVQLRVSQIQVL